MDEFVLRTLNSNDDTQMEALLAAEGLKRDGGLDFSCGIFDTDKLVATGSCEGNTLRCLAVSKEYQGYGLLNRVVQQLIKEQQRRGNYHIFLYTKPQNSYIFEDLGFSEIAQSSTAVFMENRRNGFSDYLRQLREETERSGKGHGRNAALVMNANPFTLGHRYLAEQAANSCDTLHIFVVSEDASEFSAADRFELVKKGTAHIANAVLHGTGSYLISRATFPSYFLPSDDSAALAQAEIEASIFTKIADAIGIEERFFGEEPFSAVTNIYNQTLGRLLPENGIRCTIIPRLQTEDGATISASSVRKALKDGDWKTVEAMAADSTLEYLLGVSLEEMLEARDNRVSRQKEMLHLYDLPLIYLTLNIPGPVKLPRGAQEAFDIACKRVDEALKEKGRCVKHFWSATRKTGCEACWAVDAPDVEIKELMTQIEDADAFGRLLDLDVISKSGEKLSRKSPRKCLMCELPASVCARNRTHGVDEMMQRIDAIIEETLR